MISPQLILGKHKRKGRIWRRKAAQGGSSGSAWLQPEVRDDTVAGRKNRLFRLPFSLLGLTEREGDQTDFGEREEGGSAGPIGLAWPRAGREELGRNRPNDLGKDLKTFSN